MSDGSPVTPELDARMLADLREWRVRADTRDGARWSMRLTLDELDMLLRRCDELEALKRRECEMPDERPSAAVAIPAGHAVIGGKVVPLAPPHPGVMHIAGEGGVLCGADRVSHVTDGRRYADCPACIAVFDERRHTCRHCGTRIKSTPAVGVFEHVASASIVGLHPAEPIA